MQLKKYGVANARVFLADGRLFNQGPPSALVNPDCQVAPVANGPKVGPTKRELRRRREREEAAVRAAKLAKSEARVALGSAAAKASDDETDQDEESVGNLESVAIEAVESLPCPDVLYDKVQY